MTVPLGQRTGFEDVQVYFTHDCGVDGGTQFKAGRFYKLTLPSAERWIRRGVAVLKSDYDAAEKVIEAAEKAEFDKAEAVKKAAK